jgi:serine/threonine-protein kinase HSL1, negative regulator of Swe1 kinase
LWSRSIYYLHICIVLNPRHYYHLTRVDHSLGTAYLSLYIYNMDPAHHVRPIQSTRRRPLGDATLRANQDHRFGSPQHEYKSKSYDVPSSSPKDLPHNESLMQNGSSLAVRHQLPQPSPQHKRVSAVVKESRPRNTKRDSEISNTSTISSTGGRKRKTHIGPWQLGRTIGRGGCSRVRIVRHSATGQYGAAKIISKATADRVCVVSGVGDLAGKKCLFVWEGTVSRRRRRRRDSR